MILKTGKMLRGFLRVFLNARGALPVAFGMLILGCGPIQQARPLTVFSQIEFEFLTHSDNSVFGLQPRPLLLPGRSDVPDEFRNPLPRCTGFFVTESLFLTAFHCVPNIQVARFDHWSASSDWLSQVVAGDAGRLLFSGLAQEPRLHTLSGDDLLLSNSDLDVALVRWSHSGEHGVLPVCRSNVFAEKSSLKVQLMGFPHGLPLSKSFGEAYPLLPRISSSLVAHDADSLAGESGGPLLALSDNNQECVAGIHLRGGGRNTFKNPLSQSEQLSAAEHAQQACRSEPVEKRSECEQAYAFNKALRMDHVLSRLRTESSQLWHEIVD